MAALIRAPYLTYALKKRQVDLSEQNICMAEGYWIAQDEIEEIAEKNKIELHELTPNLDVLAHKRLKTKLDGIMSEYLLNFTGPLRDASSSYAESLTLVQDGEVALPARCADVLIIEEMLSRVQERVKLMQKKIQQRFAQSHHEIVFREQTETGEFKPNHRGTSHSALMERKKTSRSTTPNK